MNTSRWLVCEGRCNPNLEALDDAIVMFRRGVVGHVGRSKVYPVEVDLAERLRKLDHTEHVQQGKVGRWKCTDCGHERWYGRTPMLDVKYWPRDLV